MTEKQLNHLTQQHKAYQFSPDFLRKMEIFMTTVTDVLNILKLKAAEASDNVNQITTLKDELTAANDRAAAAEAKLAAASAPDGATAAELQIIADAASAIGAAPAA